MSVCVFVCLCLCVCVCVCVCVSLQQRPPQVFQLKLAGLRLCLPIPVIGSRMLLTIQTLQTFTYKDDDHDGEDDDDDEDDDGDDDEVDDGNGNDTNITNDKDVWGHGYALICENSKISDIKSCLDL